MVQRRLDQKSDSLNAASRKSLKIQENQIFPLESALDQLLSGLIRLLCNSRVALFSLFVTLPLSLQTTSSPPFFLKDNRASALENHPTRGLLSLKLCISFFTVTERCFKALFDCRRFPQGTPCSSCPQITFKCQLRRIVSPYLVFPRIRNFDAPLSPFCQYKIKNSDLIPIVYIACGHRRISSRRFSSLQTQRSEIRLCPQATHSVAQCIIHHFGSRFHRLPSVTYQIIVVQGNETLTGQ